MKTPRLRDNMPLDDKTKRGLPKHCCWHHDRHGTRRVRFRKNGFSSYLTGTPWGDDFMQQYAQAIDGVKAQAGQSNADTSEGSVVYFIKIGKAIKIGFTINLKKRTKAFTGASAETISVLAVFSGGRRAERYLHNLFSSERITHEFFRHDFFIDSFLNQAKRTDLSAALQWAKDYKAIIDRTHADEKFFKEQEKIRSEKAYQEMVAERIRLRDTRAVQP